MSRGEDIPQDIFEVASRIAEDMPAKVGPFTREFAADVIARAIMAERERCSMVAFNYMMKAATNNSRDGDVAMQAAAKADAAADIGTAIRAGG